MADHDHTAAEVSGAAHGNDLLALQRRVEELEARLEAERAVPQAVADGNTTAATIAAAIRRYAGNLDLLAGGKHVDDELFLAARLQELADQIDPEE